MPTVRLPTIPKHDVASHNSEKSCYVTIDTNVYDITSFLPDHPGGEDLILQYGGKDVSDIMGDEISHVHSEAAYEILNEHIIGFAAQDAAIEASIERDRPEGTVPVLPKEARTAAIEADNAIEKVDTSKPVHTAIGLSSVEDLAKGTDPNMDYETHRFLDLNKPLLMQVWNGGFSKDFYLEQVHRPRYYSKGDSAPLFGNFLEPLSKTAWYVIPIVWLPPVAYGSLLAYQSLPSFLQTAAYWLIGLALWTLVEYCVHRGIHVDEYIPGNRVGITAHFLLHGIHHYLPMDKYRLVMPPILFVPLATPFYKLAHIAFFYDWYIATAVFCGGIFGYICYDLTHYFLHHKALPSHYKQLKICHLKHHYSDYENSFGVTSRFWDIVFGTDITPLNVAPLKAARAFDFSGLASSALQERQHNTQSQKLHVHNEVVQSVIPEKHHTMPRQRRRRLQYEVIAGDRVAVVLIRHENLSPLYEEVLSEIGKDLFGYNFLKLLKLFYLDLLQDANTDLERAISCLLKGRHSRIRVVAHVVEQHRPLSDRARSNWDSHNRVMQDKATKLDQEISSNNAFTPNAQRVEPLGPLPHASQEVDSDSDEDEHEDPEVDDRNAVLPPVAEIRSFLVGSNAFRNLVTGLRILLLPLNIRPLSRIIMTIPSDRLWFSTKEDLSLSNKIKTFVEHISEEHWCWWPFRPRMRLLQNEETRMHWQCHCGTHLSTEMSASHAKLVSDLLANRGTVNEQNHLCRARRRQDFWSWSRISDAMQYARPSASGPQGQHSPSAGPSSSQNQPTIGVSRTSQHNQTRNTSTTQEAQTKQQEPTNTAIDVQGTSQSVVLLGVKGPRITLELAQIDTVKNGKDNLFFWSLKQQYKQHRGSVRYWLSIWRLNHCDFVKFEKIWADTMISRGKDLPTDTIYDYDPRPPNADNPPISQHEFEAAFASCRHQCMLAPFHDCQKVPDRDFALKRIPKRKLEVETKINRREDVWGLQARYAISFSRVLIYHCLILGGAVAFWAWWLVKHPGDLQSAAVPLTTCLTLLSLFWSSAGILKGSRD